ncbi:hypothetical protein [Bacillus paramobilis]|uniref:hypothetical protein n=1 Tax=Bacillus paramobilis TaxID=2817477 RepID=UPI003217A1A6
MKSKQQKFYGKVKNFYGLESIEDAKRFYTAFNQLNKINTVDKANKNFKQAEKRFRKLMLLVVAHKENE